jgi:hypothetical protein
VRIESGQESILLRYFADDDLAGRDSPLFLGISFSGVGGPLKAPRKID